ncbi:MAG: proteasome assembly chaperone family protein [Thermoplasmatota archaeon]
MDDMMIRYIEKPELDRPILIEGLPGVGNVGKLAAEHLISELDFVKFAEIYSKYLPPQVIVSDDGVVNLVKHDLYYYKRKGDLPDVIVLTGDYQGLTPEGQYTLSYETIKFVKEMDVSLIFTLGGFGVIRMVSEPQVLGAVTDQDMVKDFEKLGVVFRQGEPSSGIIGASGLLLGIGKLEGIKGICLMGETSGYFVDPRSARAVLKILGAYLEESINYSSLEEKAAQIDEITSKIKEDLEERELADKRGDDLGYFG